MMPSYHDLYIETKDIPRTSIFRLGYGLEVTCTRVGGWRLWSHYSLTGEYLDGKPRLLAGEYDGRELWLKLDVDGHIIVDSLTSYDEQEETERQSALIESI